VFCVLTACLRKNSNLDFPTDFFRVSTLSRSALLVKFGGIDCSESGCKEKVGTEKKVGLG
jgi:hypothetical protein